MSRGLHWSEQQYDDYCRRHSQGNAVVVHPVVNIQVPKPKGRQPNKTEAAYGLILEAQKRKGEIIHYVYEGLSLRWGDSMRYTCDYLIIVEDAPMRLVECKGGYIRPKDLIRFKGCRAEWKIYFDFEMHQKKEGSWIRLF